MIEFQRLLEARIKQEIIDHNADTAAGHAGDYAAYRSMVGYRSGLEMALTIITEIAKEMNGG